jgi:hypothetical protein
MRLSVLLIDKMLKNEAFGFANDANFISAFCANSLSLCFGTKFSGAHFSMGICANV